MKLKDIILTTLQNFTTLANGGTVTKDGETFSYDSQSVYAVECDQLELVKSTSGTLTDEQILSAKAVGDALDAQSETIVQLEHKGKMTLSGTEYTVTKHTLSWVDGGTTHSYEVLTV